MILFNFEVLFNFEAYVTIDPPKVVKYVYFTRKLIRTYAVSQKISQEYVEQSRIIR